MADQSLTVLSSHQILPVSAGAATAGKVGLGTETSQKTIEKARICAASHLRRKNRKSHTMRIEFPGAMVQFESGTNYTLSGFSPDVDASKWHIDDVEFHCNAKGGFTTHVSMHQVPPIDY